MQATSLRAQISGSVFRDFNGNGSKDANEPLVPGVTVNAYNSSNALIASYKSAGAASPNYLIPAAGPVYNNTPGSNTGSVAAATAVRIEFIFPSASACVQAGIDYSSFAGTGNGTSVQFATGSSTNVNLALHNPNDFNRGTAALDSNFVAELGIFQPGFTPDSSNLGDWTTRWQSFGSVPYNDVDQYFGGTTTLHDNATAPAGSQIYLWLRNDTGTPEWFVATNDSTDGNPADNWVMPEIAGTDQTDRPMYFDLNFLTAPQLSVPFGKTPTVTGGGDFNETPVSFTIQTHVVVVPEPGTIALCLAGLTVVGIRRRPRV